MRPFFSFLIILAVQVSAFGQPTDVKSSVTEAIVYRDQVQLTLKATATLPAGEHEVVLKQMPAELNQTTLQVRGQGDFTILGATTRTGFLQEADFPARYRTMRDSLENLKDALRIYQAQRETYGREEEMLLLNRTVGGANTGLQVAELQKATDYFRQRLLEVKNKELSLDQKIKRTDELVKRLQAQVPNHDEFLNRPVNQIVVRVRSQVRQPATLFVTFLTSNASWTPVYDVKAQEGGKTLALTMKAEVYQATGLDWSNVRLSLSSGMPGMGAQKPELRNLYVDYERPRVVYNMERKAKTMNAYAPAAGVAQSAPMADADMEAAQVQVAEDDGGLSMLYTLEQPANLPSQPTPLTFEVSRKDIPAQLRLASAPAADQDVFVVATVKNWGIYNLLPGLANVFYDGTYSGQSTLPASLAQDSLSISLGRDKKVLVKRLAVPSTETKNFFGNQRRQAFAFDITIRNNHKEAVTLALEDRVPISRNGEIEVETDQLSGGTLKEGKVTWDLNLTPGETHKIRIEYTIKSPKGKGISIY